VYAAGSRSNTAAIAGASAQDVPVDRRGVIYMSEGNSGIYILAHHPSRP
jgi:hypothetical protein